MANGLVIAAPRSGSGKTILTLGLLAALRLRGVRVAPAKSGPDYIDAAILGRAAGSDAINLDPWAMTSARLRDLAASHATGADLLLVEGAMGLFDGAADGRGSTGDLAAALELPVVLVVDAERQSQSIAPLVAGFAHWRENVRIAGVIVNRSASTRHEMMLRRALVETEIPVLGVIPRRDGLVLPERHLGLVLPDEVIGFEAVLQAASDVIGEYVDLNTLLAVSAPLLPSPLVGEGARRADEGSLSGMAAPSSGAAHHLLPRGEKEEKTAAIARSVSASAPQAPLLPSPPVGEGARRADEGAFRDIAAPSSGAARHLLPRGEKEGKRAAIAGSVSVGLPPLGQRIAIARDDAFAFLYLHWLSGWRAAGAELSFFSPLADEPPDASADAVFLPGGYPELHGARLAAATRFKAGLVDAQNHGALIYGECGGFMVLGETLTDKAGVSHAMTGLLPVSTRIDRPKRTLGYRRLSHGSPLPWPQSLNGHEFHYSSTKQTRLPPLFTAADALGEALPPMGAVIGKVLGSYAHIIDVG